MANVSFVLIGGIISLQASQLLLQKLASDPRCKGMPLSSFLLKHMQRITRYPLLIRSVSAQNGAALCGLEAGPFEVHKDQILKEVAGFSQWPDREPLSSQPTPTTWRDCKREPTADGPGSCIHGVGGGVVP